MRETRTEHSRVSLPRPRYYRLMKAKVSQDGRVTLPKALRDLLGISPGDAVELDEEDGQLVISKVATDDPADVSGRPRTTPTSS